MIKNRSKWAFWFLGILIFLAPLFRGGNIPSALLVLELLSVLILMVLWRSPIGSGKLTWVQIVALGGLLLLPLIYLIPLPVEVAQMLPGRTDYFGAILLETGADSLNRQTLSLYPRETFAGWLVLLLPLAAFLSTRSLETRQLRALLTLVFVIAGFQAVLGLIQFGTGPDSPFYLGMTHTHFGSAVGTYTSRNNYVGLLYMMLMITLALFMATLGRHRAKAGRQTFRQRLLYLSTMRGHQAVLYAVFSLLILLAIVFSRSRAGIGLTMVGIVLTSIVFARRIGGRNVFGMTGTIVTIMLGFGISIGLAPVLDRFSAGDPLTDGRWVIFDGTIRGILQFFPIGSGPATFRETFPAFQDLSHGGYIINQAHNDYLEWMYDGGLIAGLLILVFLSLYVFRWRDVWKKENWGEFRYIQVGAGIGMLLMLLHEGVDYNLFIPANMVFFAFFAGLFFHQYDETSEAESGQKIRDPDVRQQVPSMRIRPVVQPIFDESDKNPFMD